MEPNDEQQVQQHIQDTGGGQGDERYLSLADAAEDSGFKVVEQDGGHTQEIDAQVEQGEGVDVLWHLKQVQQAAGDQLADDGYDDPSYHRHDQGGVNGVLCAFSVVVANGVGDDYGGAQSDADEKPQDQVDNRPVGAYGGYGGGAAAAGEVAHYGYVRSIKQLP